MEELDPKTYKGGLTLTCEGEAGTLANITGSASFGSISGAFKGVAVRFHLESKQDGVKKEEIPNCWALLKSTLCDTYDNEEDVEDDSDSGMHSIAALEPRDDHGHPFVEFVYEAGWSGCCPQYLTYVAKRQVDEGNRKGLSDAERERLGMGLGTKEVERKVKEEHDADIPVDSEPSGSSATGAMKRKAEVENEDEKERLSVKPKLEHA